MDHAFEVGASGVHIFFVISGFVMVYTSIRSNLTCGSFLKRRLIRIYPIYWVIFAAYLAAHQLLGTPVGSLEPKLGDRSYLLYVSHVLDLDLILATPIRELNVTESAAICFTLSMRGCVVVAGRGYQ